MTSIDKLRETLCTVDAIKKQLSYKYIADVGVIDLYPDVSELPVLIQERHLRMYCKEKGIELIIQANGVVKTIDRTFQVSTVYNVITNLDNTKDFHLQDDLVIEKINTLLEKLLGQ